MTGRQLARLIMIGFYGTIMVLGMGLVALLVTLV